MLLYLAGVRVGLLGWTGVTVDWRDVVFVY